MHPQLKQYTALADMLAATFGQDCEVVLHDLADPEHSVVYVANGHVTGRKVGQGIEHLVREAVAAGNEKRDFAVNDYFRKKGRLIRSSSLFIRDEQGRMIGAMCINLDTTVITQQIDFLKSFIPQSQIPEAAGEADSNQVESMVSSLIDNVLSGCDVRLLSREERIRKISFMEQKGIFQVKGSIELVAQRLGINKVTVYSYLDEIKKNSP